MLRDYPFHISLTSLYSEKLFSTALMIFLLLNSIQPIHAREQEDPKQVLIIFSHPFGLPWQNEITRVIYDAFESNTDVKTKLDAEYPGLSLTFNDFYVKSLIELYGNKYSDRRIDLIFAIDTAASSFMLSHRDTVFPDVPVISIAVRDIIEQGKMESNWIGIYPVIKVKETLDLAIGLHSGTQNVAVISGSSKTDHSIETTARMSLKEYEDHLNLIYLSDFSMNEILEKVAVLPKHTVVLYLSTFMDFTGKTFIPRNILKDITAASNAPVYSLWSTHIDSGVVGGYMISPEMEGKALSDIGFRILKGEKIEDIPVDKTLSSYLFDWRQMERWGISKRDIPPESTVLFREYTFWDLYKWQMIGTICIVLLEALLIFILLIQRSRLHSVRISLTSSQKELEFKVEKRTNDLTLTNIKLEKEIIKHTDAEEHVKVLLEEKEIIMQEVHHRIKNNMATVMSLLSLQSMKMENPKALEALEDAGNRIQSMMILYDKLYRGSDFQNISIGDYFITLTKEIAGNFDNSNKVHIETSIENFVLDSKRVFNLGIILNELITNSMKYAYPDGKEGKITISASIKNNHIVIIIQDDGIGLPQSGDVEISEGFGLSLVNMLSEQIGAVIKTEKGNGTKITLEFDK